MLAIKIITVNQFHRGYMQQQEISNSGAGKSEQRQQCACTNVADGRRYFSSLVQHHSIRRMAE
jgi:hypothetical protein